jgi:hypothetical protein
MSVMMMSRWQKDSRIKAIDEALPWIGLFIMLIAAVIGPTVSTLIPAIGIACWLVGTYRNIHRLVVRACDEWREKKQKKQRKVFSYYE